MKQPAPGSERPGRPRADSYTLHSQNRNMSGGRGGCNAHSGPARKPDRSKWSRTGWRLVLRLSSVNELWSGGGLQRGTREGPARMNQKDGFGCSSCAWPDLTTVQWPVRRTAPKPCIRRRRQGNRPQVFLPSPGRTLAHDRPRPGRAGRLTLVKRPGDNH
jgi:hypothetical protein